jgi:uncharacterized protein YndB with AHSA1/START domain
MGLRTVDPPPKGAAMPAHPPAVRREVTLPAAPEDVWTVLTTEDGLEEWLAAEVQLDLREGGEAVFRYADGRERRAVIETVQDGTRLVLRWLRDGEESRVEFLVEAVSAGTRLLVVESGLLPGMPSMAAGGWAPALRSLGELTAGAGVRDELPLPAPASRGVWGGSELEGPVAVGAVSEERVLAATLS